MKTLLLTFLCIVLFYPAALIAQKQTITFTTAGNYNDFILEHWKNASKKFHEAAAALNEPIRSKKALLAKFKSATMVIDENLQKLGNVSVFNNDDKDFMISTFNLLRHYQYCTDKIYPKIIENLTAPSYNIDTMQKELDELSNFELSLTQAFLKAQAAFAEHYNFELK